MTTKDGGHITPSPLSKYPSMTHCVAHHLTRILDDHVGMKLPKQLLISRSSGFEFYLDRPKSYRNRPSLN